MEQNQGRGVLAYRLLFLILVCSSVITIMATFFQLATTYHSGVKSIGGQLKQLELTHTNSLSKSLWIFDTAQIKIELEGILNYPDINYAEVISNGEKVISIGNRLENPIEVRRIKLNYQTQMNNLELGELYVQATDNNVKNKVREQIAVILVSQAIKTFIVSAFILFIINFLITKPLEKIANYTKDLDLRHADELKLERARNEKPDELDILVNSINSMRRNLQRAYADLQTEANERKVAKDELFKQANLLENIINGIPAYIYWRDLSGNYMGCNDLYANLLGVESSQLIGRGVEEISSIQKAIEFHQLDNDVLISRKPKWNQEICIDFSNNSTGHFVQSVVPMYNRENDAFGILGLFIDVTTKKNAETERETMKSQVIQSAKMASIGELASGIGHEINNPLAIIQGNLELLESYLEHSDRKDSEVEKLVQNQMVAINRIRGIVDGLRVFAREDDKTEKKEVVDLHEALRETFQLVNSLYVHEGVKIYIDFTAENFVILGNRNKLQQAVLNLISNAKDAVLDNKNNSKNEIVISTYNKDKNVFLNIKDNGIGMDDQLINKIFDSYFTTKPAGKGTGIGLDLTKKIIESFGGEIGVKSELGQGSEFILKFPLTSEFARRTVQKLDSQFGGNVLIVDDDITVRQLIRKHLEGLGFEVIEASSGPEAISIMTKKRFDGIFTDMRMPEMTGVELLEKLHALDCLPTYKILVTGGLDEQAEVNELLDGDLQFDLVLNKPFSRRELARHLKLLFESAT
ncbi:MAG: ATP-binding protein [Bdellovibrionota bacterium]|nr:ATP-binding protein [Bdellovibrionota bacterium]